MSDQASPSFIGRVINNDTFRKSVAGIIAGTLVAVISETFWPSES